MRVANVLVVRSPAAAGRYSYLSYVSSALRSTGAASPRTTRRMPSSPATWMARPQVGGVRWTGHRVAVDVDPGELDAGLGERLQICLGGQCTGQQLFDRQVRDRQEAARIDLGAGQPGRGDGRQCPFEGRSCRTAVQTLSFIAPIPW
ncbi:hypothetical protein [Streptomyces sp. NPDC017993]|uniref:hypothetical protein n=1 Tax=Streptomyces sp. NPDC017993 TaxID=3365027 RepID=UPI0037A8BD76